MYISDGQGRSIFCRMMEKARPMREEVDGKVVYFPPESAFSDFDVMIYKPLFRICSFDWACKQLFPAKENV